MKSKKIDSIEVIELIKENDLILHYPTGNVLKALEAYNGNIISLVSPDDKGLPVQLSILDLLDGSWWLVFPIATDEFPTFK